MDERERLTRDKIQYELYRYRRAELLWNNLPFLLTGAILLLITVLCLCSALPIGWKIAGPVLLWGALLWAKCTLARRRPPTGSLRKIKAGQFRIEKATVSYVEEYYPLRSRQSIRYYPRYRVHFSLYAAPVFANEDQASLLREGEECYVAVEEGSDKILRFYRAASYRLEE